MTSFEILEKPDSGWNQKLLSSPYGIMSQTSEYGSYIESRFKSKPLYIKFFNNKGQFIGQLLVFRTIKGRKRINKFFGQSFFYSSVMKMAKLMPKYFHWYFGPIIFDKSYQTSISETLGNLIVSWKREFEGTTHPLNPDFEFPTKFNFKKQKESTFVIDLKQDIQKILTNTDKHSVQKNIKRSQERGVFITEIKSKDDIMTYYELQKKYRLQNKLQPYSRLDLEEGFFLLKRVGLKGFIAWYDKIPVGAISFSSFNGYICESGIARSGLDSEKNLYSQDLLRWKIIEWGVKNNCNYYDLAGIKPADRSPKEEGIFRNKKKWGGTQYNYGLFKK